MPQIGEKYYRDGAKERLAESMRLFQSDQLAGSVYLAGRAVEGMFRALIWKSDADYRHGRRSLETGHNLRSLLIVIGNLGLLSDRDDEMRYQVEIVSSQWANNMRFVPKRWVESCWRELGVVNKRVTIRLAAANFCDVCSKIIQRCEELYDATDNE